MKRIQFLNQKGVAAIEFALLLPLLLLLIFSIIEFGVIFYNQAMLTNASREGARAGVVYRYDYDNGNGVYRLSEQEIETLTASYLQDRLISFSGNPDFEFNPPPEYFEDANTGDEFLSVHITYPYNFLLLHVFAKPLGLKIDLSARSIMRMEDSGGF